MRVTDSLFNSLENHHQISNHQQISVRLFSKTFFKVLYMYFGSIFSYFSAFHTPATRSTILHYTKVQIIQTTLKRHIERTSSVVLLRDFHTIIVKPS